jgi:hypothetical protein
MKKFKHWLIRKLGGCLPDRKEIRLTKTVVNPITVSAAHEEFAFDCMKKKYPVYDVYAHIREILAREIAQQLFLHELCEVKQSYDEFTDRTLFVASIKVIPQERSEGK